MFKAGGVRPALAKVGEERGCTVIYSGRGIPKLFRKRCFTIQTKCPSRRNGKSAGGAGSDRGGGFRWRFFGVRGGGFRFSRVFLWRDDFGLKARQPDRRTGCFHRFDRS